MLYQKFFNWLFRDKDTCPHEWEKSGYSYSSFKATWTETGFRNVYKCNKCNKKEKRIPKNAPTNVILR